MSSTEMSAGRRRVRLETGPPERVEVTIGDLGHLRVVAVPVDAAQATVQLDGELDMANAQLVGAILEHQLGLGRRTVTLDLSRLIFCDCAGLRMMVRAHHQFLDAGGSLVLIAPYAPVARLLRMTGLNTVLYLVDPLLELPTRRHLVALPP